MFWPCLLIHELHRALIDNWIQWINIFPLCWISNDAISCLIYFQQTNQDFPAITSNWFTFGRTRRVTSLAEQMASLLRNTIGLNQSGHSPTTIPITYSRRNTEVVCRYLFYMLLLFSAVSCDDKICGHPIKLMNAQSNSWMLNQTHECSIKLMNAQ